MGLHGHKHEHEHGTVPIDAAVLTISDKGYRGEREDRSGEVIREILSKELDCRALLYDIVPDEKELIIEKLNELKEKVNLILTTGGTGVAPRDVTPEATREVIEKELPGYAEAMRMESLKITPRAMGSRAVAGVAGQCLIINLPGSPKAVEECLRVVLPAISHTIELIQGKVDECARK